MFFQRHNKRRRLLALALLACALMATLGLAWQILSDNSLLERFLLSRLQRTFGKSIRYGAIQTHFTGVDFYDVEYHPPARGKGRFFVKADEVNVRLSYVGVLSDLFRAEPRVLRVAVVNPTLFLTPPADTTTANAHVREDSASWRALSSFDPLESFDRNRSLASRYRFVESVELSGGKIVLTDHASTTYGFTALDHIRGSIRSTGRWQAEMKVSGDLVYPSVSQITLATEIDLRYIALDSLALRVEDFHPQGRLPLTFPGSLEMENGALAGNLLLTRVGGEAAIAGELHLRDGQMRLVLTPSSHDSPQSHEKKSALKIPQFLPESLSHRVSDSLLVAPVVFEAVNLDLRLQEGWLTITRGDQIINGQRMSFEGRLDASQSSFYVALREIADRILPPRADTFIASASARSASVAAPEMDFTFSCDSLALHDFLSRLLPQEEKMPPLAGIVAVNGMIAGTLARPCFHAEITAPALRVHDKHFTNLRTELWYRHARHDATTASVDDSKLGWHGAGMLDLTGREDDEKHNPASDLALGWEGWGTIDLASRHLPLDLTIVADGDLTPLAKTLLTPSTLPTSSTSTADSAAARRPFFSEIPEVRLAAHTRVSGSLWHPLAEGSFHLNLKRTNLLAADWNGAFTWQDDTLAINTSRPDDSFQLNAQIWQFAKRPLFRIHGVNLGLLPALFGEELAKILSPDWNFEFSLEGHADSLNVRVEALKEQSGKPLFQLLGYMLPVVKGDRVLSGYVRFFPGMENAFTARYTCHWQDSVFTVTDFHSEDWLTGALHVRTTGQRALSGNLRLANAELARLTEAFRQDEPRYRGRLFGEINLSGTLDQPQAAANFWLFDGFFNGVGNFKLAGEAHLDPAGWKIDSLSVSKDRQNFLRASASYARADGSIRLDLKGRDVPTEELLLAFAEVPRDKFLGRASFQLHARGAFSDFLGKAGIPLNGNLNVKSGTVGWFNFDEITADLRDQRSTLSHSGAYLHELYYRKHNAFTLRGKARLPFDLTNDAEVALTGEGNFLSVLPDLTTFFKSAESNGRLRLNLRGPYKKLKLPNSSLTFKQGYLQLAKIAPEVAGISGELVVDSRGNFINIRHLKGEIGDATLSVSNTETMPGPMLANAGNSLTSLFSPPLMPPLNLGNSELNLGTVLIKSSENGLPLNIPGLMKKNEVGRFQITGRVDSTTMVGVANELLIAGPWAHPMVHGRVVMENVNFQFPFDHSAEAMDSLWRNVVTNLDWNVLVTGQRNNRYVISVPAAMNNVYVNLGLDDGASRLKFTGIWSDSTFRLEGRALAHRGVLEYLDMNFRVEEFGAEFDKNDLWPVVFGRAQTVVNDSTNFPYNVYLTLHTRDATTGQELAAGRFHQAYFKLTSDQPSVFGDTQEQVLASLGYSVDRLKDNATAAVAMGTDNFLLRPIIRPVERELERKLGLDVVRFSSNFTRNFLLSNFVGNNDPGVPGTSEVRPSVWQNSRLTLGKYLASNLYFLYTGQVEAGLTATALDPADNDQAAGFENSLQLRHRLGLEYRLNPAMMLQFEYDYNPLLSQDKSDPRIWLRHSFPVEFPLTTK